jgi:hypothetical protein
MIFLSKNGYDEYINMFARGAGYSPIDTNNFVYSQSTDPIVLRGMLKYKIMDQCRKNNRTFYYMDTGYFGNDAGVDNTQGSKLWHRIVKNGLQHHDMVTRDDRRFKSLGIKIEPWRSPGRNILLVAPSDKACRYYKTTLDQWIDSTVSTIKKFTDRPVVVRSKVKNRQERNTQNTFAEALEDDVFAVVVLNSNAATEAILKGVPAFCLANDHAAAAVSKNNLEEIETPARPNNDLRHKWACHLSYGQFHLTELQNGSALKKLKEWYGG